MRKLFFLLPVIFVMSLFFLPAKNTHAVSANFGGLAVKAQNPQGQGIPGARITVWGAGGNSYTLYAPNGAFYLDPPTGSPWLSCSRFSFINFINGGWGGVNYNGVSDGYAGGDGWRVSSAFFTAYQSGVWGLSCFCAPFSVSISAPGYYTYTANNWYPGNDGWSTPVVTLTPIPPPSCSITVDRNLISAGSDSTTLRWTSANATWNQWGALSGSTVVSPDSTQTYTMSVSGPGGTRSCSRTLNVKPLPTCHAGNGGTRIPHRINGADVPDNANLLSGYDITTGWAADSNTTHVKWTLTKDGACIWGYNGAYTADACNSNSPWSTSTYNAGPMPQWSLQPGQYWSVLRMTNGLPGGDVACARGPFNVSACPMPGLTASVDKSSINQGEAVNITYTPNDASYCWLWSTDASGNVLDAGNCDATNGTHSRSYIPNTSRTYHVRVGKPNCPENTVDLPVSVSVTNSCPSLSANPNVVRQGETVRLSWSGGRNVQSFDVKQQPDGGTLATLYAGAQGIANGYIDVMPSATTDYSLDVLFNDNTRNPNCALTQTNVRVNPSQTGGDQPVPPN